MLIVFDPDGHSPKMGVAKEKTESSCSKPATERSQIARRGAAVRDGAASTKQHMNRLTYTYTYIYAHIYISVFCILPIYCLLPISGNSYWRRSSGIDKTGRP